MYDLFGMYFHTILRWKPIDYGGTNFVSKRKEDCADPATINKYRMDTEIKAYGLATFADITLPGSESFINCGAKLPLQV